MVGPGVTCPPPVRLPCHGPAGGSSLQAEPSPHSPGRQFCAGPACGWEQGGRRGYLQEWRAIPPRLTIDPSPWSRAKHPFTSVIFPGKLQRQAEQRCPGRTPKLSLLPRPWAGMGSPPGPAGPSPTGPGGARAGRAASPGASLPPCLFLPPPPCCMGWKYFFAATRASSCFCRLS